MSRPQGDTLRDCVRAETLPEGGQSSLARLLAAIRIQARLEASTRRRRESKTDARKTLGSEEVALPPALSLALHRAHPPLKPVLPLAPAVNRLASALQGHWDPAMAPPATAPLLAWGSTHLGPGLP
jgi:hypothetical protein